MCESDNIYISYVANVISLYRNSLIRSNIDIIYRRNNLDMYNVKSWFQAKCPGDIQLEMSDTVKVDAIKELTSCKDGQMKLDNFSFADLCLLTDWLATM